MSEYVEQLDRGRAEEEEETTSLIKNGSLKQQPNSANSASTYGGVGSAPSVSSERPSSGPLPSKDATNPYMGGVSRRRFWLMFGVILMQYFVRFFSFATVRSRSSFFIHNLP